MVERHEKRRLVENFLSLSFIEGARYLLPFLTIPYLVRVLGPDKYGLIIFAQGIIQYFNILTDYGFSISATHEISVNRDNPERIGEIFSSVIFIRILLMLLSLAILLFLVFSIGKLRSEYLLYLLTFGAVFGNIFSPVWFFQGLERMKYITVLSVINRLFFTIAIFLFIRNASQYIFVPVINSLASIVAGFLGLYLAFRIYPVKIKFHLPTIFYLFKKSFFFFLSRLSVSFYTIANTVIIGSIFTMKDVAYYGVAEKIVRLFRRPINLYNRVIYPFSSYKKDREFMKKAIRASLIFGILVLAGINIFAREIIMIVGGRNFEASIKLLRILSLIVPIVSVHVLLGSSVLVSFGKEKYFNLSVIFGSLFYILVLLGFYFFGILTVVAIAAIRVLVDGFILVYRIYYVRKFNLLGGSNV